MKPGVVTSRQEEDSSDGSFGGVVKGIVKGAKETVNKITTGVKSTLEKHGGEVGKTISRAIPIPFPSTAKITQIQLIKTTIRCTGKTNKNLEKTELISCVSCVA